MELDLKPAVRRVTLPGGIRLPYVEQGDPSGVPIVLLHGLTDSWRSFEGVFSRLPPSLRAFAPTLRGHGDADRPESGYRPQDFAADVAAFMDAVGLDAAVMVGHSMGSYVAQRFAIDYPGRTLGLVLMGSFATLCGNPAAQELWDTGMSTLSDPVDPAFALAFQQSTLARPVPPDLLETAVRESLKVPARVWRAAMRDCCMDADHSTELGRIAAPTLILWGDQDGLSSAGEQKSLEQAIPDARLVVYPGGGHAFHWEDPARAAIDLAAFVESRVARSGGLWP